MYTQSSLEEITHPSTSFETTYETSRHTDSNTESGGTTLSSLDTRSQITNDRKTSRKHAHARKKVRRREKGIKPLLSLQIGPTKDTEVSSLSNTATYVRSSITQCFTNNNKMQLTTSDDSDSPSRKDDNSRFDKLLNICGPRVS